MCIEKETLAPILEATVTYRQFLEDFRAIF